MTMDLIRMWTPGWSSNGTDGMMHTQGNPKYPHRTRLRLFRQSRRRRCYVKGMIRNLWKRVPVVTAFALITATRYIYGDRCLVRLCLLEQPGQRDGDVRSTNIVNDWGLAHIFTIAWCMNIVDSSYVAVCYDCLWLIDHSRVLISWFNNEIGRILTEFEGLRCVQIISASGRRCRYASDWLPGLWWRLGRTH